MILTTNNRVEVHNSGVTNRKVGPKTILCTFTGGKIKEISHADDLKWAFSSPKTQVIWTPPAKPGDTKAGPPTVATLETIIKATPKMDKIYQHNTFTSGQPPAVLISKKQVGLTDGPDNLKRARKESDDHYSILWTTSNKALPTGTQMEPTGAALVVMKQFVVPAGGRWIPGQP